MSLEQIHFLLTYNCNYECDHCFLYCSPRAKGTFTLAQIRSVLIETNRIPSVDTVYFEGGEPFLYYPVLLAALKEAKTMGLRTGIVSNTYWATSVADAEIWLRPFADLGVDFISVSDDTFHHGERSGTPAERAKTAGERLKLNTSVICIDSPGERTGPKGEPIVEGAAMLRGRAADKLTEGLHLQDGKAFSVCEWEKLRSPKRVHVDPYGYVHICQGISMGNMWKIPLAELVDGYRADKHPICGPLLDGGPALLAKHYSIPCGDGYAHACHLCYETRKRLLGRFPEYLGPEQVYGIESPSDQSEGSINGIP